MKKGSSRPERVIRRRVGGQSIVEAVVVLALVAILVIALLRGLGQQAALRLQAANAALEEAGRGGSPAETGVGIPAGPAADDGASSGSGGQLKSLP
jgi:hypothetical protein